MMGWVYRVGANGVVNYETFLSLGHSTSEYAIYINNSTTAGSWALTEWTTDYVGSTLATATWYHLAITVNGTGAGGMLGYMNGVLDITGNAISITPTGMRISGGTAGTGEWANMRTAGVKIYSAVFTQSEIVTEMWSLMPVRLANLNGWYPFFTNTDVVDHSSNLNNWTVAGTLTTEAGPPVPWSLHNQIWSIPASGGAVYTATLAGACTPSGSLVKIVNKVLQGNTTPVGSMSKRVGKVLSGAVALSGGLRKTVNKVLSGSVTPAGVLSVALRRAVSLAGALNPIGAVVKRVDKVFSGAAVPVGSITKRVDKIFSASLTLSGQLVKQVNKILAGTVNSVGGLTSNVISGGGQVYTATLSGAVGLSGALTKQVNKVLVGAVTPVGVVSKVVGRVLQGSVGVSGVVVKRVSKVFSGVVTPIGSVSKVVSKSFTGVVTPVGVLTKSYIRSIVLSGVVTPVGALVSSVIAGSGVVLRTMYPLFRRKRR
jgi:hypothetical protein